MEKWNVAIAVFDDVEVLDFAGPYEVFSRARTVAGVESRRSEASAPFRVFTVAARAAEIKAIGGLRVIPDHSFDDAPPIDLLVVPGGFGTRALLDDAQTIQWIARVAASARRVMSVCTGALLLARAGLLRDKGATTHWAALDLLASLDATLTVERERRFVDDGVITSAGVSSGIETSLYVVELVCGRAVADETAHYIEFQRTPC
jgi:transcriptional regulator GlxA family with amidase domain